ncbi:MAG: GTPase Era [Treponema sp.]
MEANTGKKSGIVCIIGRPSVGKSTFLNTVCGEKVAIVSPFPQTTRNAIRGIYTGDEGQIVFIDTPGYHNSEKKINLKFKTITEKRLQEADVILYLVDASRSFGEEETALCSLVTALQDQVFIGINKTDSPDARIGHTTLMLKHDLPAISSDRIYEISAEKKTGLSALLSGIFSCLPEGPQLYPEEYYTDQPVDFRIAEIIREQAIALVYDEIPHALYVHIEDMKMKKNGKQLAVRAFIFVERESQKAMVIGKGASMIKKIRENSQKELFKIFPYYIILDIQVKVDKNWRQKDYTLNRLFNT